MDLIAGAFGDAKYKADVIQQISDIKAELDKVKESDWAPVVPGTPIYGADLETYEKSLFRVTCAPRKPTFNDLLTIPP